MEIIYGRKFSIEELSAQPVKEISTQCLIHDNEIEQEYIRQQEMKSKQSGGNLVLGSKDVNETLFKMKYPELSDAIVTLLTTKEFEEEVAKSKHYD